MPHASVLVARPQPEIVDALLGRPELAARVYLLPRTRFAGVPAEGLLLALLPSAPRWRESDGPCWYEPDSRAYGEPPAPFAAPTRADDSPPAPLVFDPEDIARRFPLLRHELPPRRALEFCKALARRTGATIAWYNYLDRGDTLYHDAAWIFGPSPPRELVPGITVTAEAEDEELVIYDGFSGGRWRGWLLWGNAREDSRPHLDAAAARVGLRFGLSSGEGGAFPFDFPSYSNITGDIWAPLRVATPAP